MIDWIAISALAVSGFVALSQIVKELREGRLAKRQGDQIEREATNIPIKGAGDAVIALQNALKVANENEDRLRARIVHLEKENDIKDQQISELERRVWTLERQLAILKGDMDVS